MERLAVQQAAAADLPRILEVYEAARKLMRKTGNASQWGHFPPEALLAEDIRAGHLDVVRQGGVIHGVFALLLGADPAYEKSEQGQWLSDTAYGTLHRVAGGGAVHGIFDAAIAFSQEKSRHLRIDTHRDNRVMRHLIQKNGFQRCGIIYTEDGTPRIAYERL